MFNYAGNKQSIGEIWKSSLSFYKHTFGKIWYVALVMVLIMQLPRIFHLLPLHTAQMAHVTTGMMVSYVTILIASLLVGLLMGAIILHRMDNLITDSNYSVKDSIVYSLSKYLIMLIATIIVYALLILAFIVLVGLFGLLGKAGVIFGVFLWLLFAVFVGILFLLNIPLILFDHKGSIGALKSSASLVWGNWWRTFVVIMVPALLFALLTVIIQAVARNPMANFIVAIILTMLFIPLLQGVILVQFNDLKLRAPDKS